MTTTDVHSDNRGSAVRLEDGKLYVFERDGVFQARIRLSDGRYIWRSLRTRDETAARNAAQNFYHSTVFNLERGFPLRARSLNSVIDEYVVFRALQHSQGHTSYHMLRQIKRVVRFWREYLGRLSVEQIGDRELSGYVAWRKAYYSNVGCLPRNARLNPTDKTLQWEIALGKSIIKWAHEQGYRGTQQLPTFSFTPKKKRVRPAFELHEYRRLLRSLVAWRKSCPNSKWLHTRTLLTDYVLILANTGMRVGEANNLKFRDIELFVDDLGRRNFRFRVKGKTGERDVIMRASAAKSVDRLRARKSEARPDDWLFSMAGGRKVITLIDQFDGVLRLAGIVENSHGDKYTLYSLRHFYAVQALKRGVGVFDLARNMGTSVQVIQTYYGRHATPIILATQLGG